MIKGKQRVSLTKEEVLSRISEYDIFKYYMPQGWQLNRATNSPFRKDNNPSFVIGNRNGYVSFIDFGDVNFRGDCFTFVKLLFHMRNMDEVLRKIDNDFSLGISSGIVGDYKSIISKYEQPTEVKRYSLVQVVTKKFTKSELDYWASYHLSLDDLRQNNVYSVKKVYLNRQLFPSKLNELVFGYFYEGGYWKIYRPESDRKRKWMPNNVPITAMDGKENIVNCDVALISKSRKDYMVMRKVFPCSCAVQNESIACFSQENVSYLKDNSKVQILSFDSDEVGVNNSRQITQLFDFQYANVPRKYLSEGIKDWAELARVHGMEELVKCLKEKNLL
jgi:hypothetical protein